MFPFERMNIGIGGGQVQNPTTLQAVSDLNAARNLYAPGHLTNKLLGYLQEGVVWANGLGNNAFDPMGGGGGLSGGASGQVGDLGQSGQLSSALGGLNALTGGQGSDSLSLLANSGFDSSSLGGSGLGGGIGGGVPGYGFTGGISPLSLITNILQGLLSFLSPSPPIENTGIFGGGAPGPAGGLDNFSSGGFIPSLSRADVGGLNPQPLDQPAAVQARQIIFGQVKPGTELRDPTAQGRLTQLRQLLLGL